MNDSTLQQMLKEAHALSFQARFIPVDATPEDEYFRVSPPTYVPEKQGYPPRYLITDHGEVRLDSPQSFANRLEACIHDAGLTASFDVVAQDGSPLVNSRELAQGVYVLHCFQKKTQQTAERDIELARQRFKLIGD